MMQKIKLIISAIIVANGCVFAQNETDALRYAFYDYQGTARYTSMGGAFGALGGDLSALNQNPAGIAIYRRGEFSISPGFLFNNSESTYNGSISKDLKQNLNIGNIGFALAIPPDKEQAIKFFHFGINYNRLKDFHNNYTISGENSSSSLSDVFANLSNGIESENLLDALPFTGGLAWETYLIDPVAGSNNEYVSVFPGGNVNQTKIIETKGRSTQTDLAFGFNAEDAVYFGLGIGIMGIFYEETSIHAEDILEENVTDLQSFSYREDLEIQGSGINFNVGTIVRITDAFRLGLAYHSPKWYSMEDTWNTRIITNFENGESYDEGSLVGFNTYRITTPYRLVGSAAFILGKKGLISADYEFIDYSNSKLKPDDLSPSDFSNANNEIELQYGPTHNIRVGGEIRLLPYSLRAGVSIYDTPYNQGFTMEDPTRYSFSIGGGIKSGKKYLDLAYRYTMFNSDYYLYDPELVNSAAITHRNNQIRLTLGIKI